MSTATTQDGRTEFAEQLECYSFTFLLSGFEELSSEIENALYDAGCDDALLGIHAGTPTLSFDRESESLEDAIKSALKDVEKCDGIEVVRVIPPGADTIEVVNAYLRVRRQFHHQSRRLHGELSDEMAQRIEILLSTLMENDPNPRCLSRSACETTTTPRIV